MLAVKLKIKLFSVICAFFLAFPAITWAVSVTVNSPGLVEGSFDITGTVTFDANNPNGDEGRIYVKVVGLGMNSKTFEGTQIDWSLSEIWGYELDAGEFSNGNHIIEVWATPFNGDASEHVYGTFIIDNTPVITINNPGLVEGSFDITGTAIFKEHAGGNEGRIYVKVVGLGMNSKAFEGTQIDWSLSEIWGYELDAGEFSNGNHIIEVWATPFNGDASEHVYGTFIIDKTPEVTISNPGPVEGDFDITGTVRFKESSGGGDGGTVYVYIGGTVSENLKGSKTYSSTDVSWSYSNIVGNLLNSFDYSVGEHKIYMRARSNNG